MGWQKYFVIFQTTMFCLLNQRYGKSPVHQKQDFRIPAFFFKGLVYGCLKITKGFNKQF